MSDDLNLTALQVEEALSRPPEKNAEGHVVCQICDRPFPKPGSLGVHQLVHRRAVGLAPPMANGKAAPKSVVCRYEGCTEMMIRASLRSHMMGRHGMTMTEASFYMRKRRDEDLAEIEKREKRKPKPPPEAPEPEPTPADEVMGILGPEENGDEYRSQFVDITAAELVQGILTSVRPDGRIPITMLPDVIELIAHVEAVVIELGEYGEAT